MKESFLAMLSGHLTLSSIYHLLGGMVFLYIFWFVLYKVLKEEFIFWLDFKQSEFETNFIKEFTKYLAWGTFQQIVVVSVVYFSSYFLDGISSVSQFLIAMLFFNLIHLPNLRLTLATTGVSLYFYVFFYFYDIGSPLYFGIMHAFGGTCYKQLGWEMRVLWNYPKK